MQASPHGISTSRTVLAMLAAAMLSGCAVGPDFTAPAAPATPSYTAGTQPTRTSAADAPQIAVAPPDVVKL